MGAIWILSKEKPVSLKHQQTRFPLWVSRWRIETITGSCIRNRRSVRKNEENSSGPEWGQEPNYPCSLGLFSLPNRMVLMHIISLCRMPSSDSSYQGSGGNIGVYGPLLSPEILRAFSADFCQRWPIHAKKEGIPESGITKFCKSWKKTWKELQMARK